MSYKLIEGGVQRLADGAWIPADPMNADWQEYQRWQAKGNAAQPADPPPARVVPAKLQAVLDDQAVPQSLKNYLREMHL